MEKYLDLGYQTRGFSVAKEHLTVVQLRGYVLRGACFLSLHSADKKKIYGTKAFYRQIKNCMFPLHEILVHIHNERNVKVSS